MKIGDWELNEREQEQLAESRREIDELFKRKDKFTNGAEALQEFRDLFDSGVRPLPPADAGGGARPVPD